MYSLCTVLTRGDPTPPPTYPSYMLRACGKEQEFTFVTTTSFTHPVSAVHNTPLFIHPLVDADTNTNRQTRERRAQSQIGALMTTRERQRDSHEATGALKALRLW